MPLVENLFLLCGAIALFLYALKLLAEGIGEMAGEGLSKVVRNATSNRLSAVIAGALCTAVAQSSVATNMIVVALVEKNVISFLSASAVIMGTNIGTTITAQLVSLSTVSEFDVIALGSFVAFIGFLFSLSKKPLLKSLGKCAIGFGFVFMGIQLLTNSVENFKSYAWFTGLFLVKSPILLFLNGFFITAILQSSSVVTSVMIVLANLGLLNLENALFIILGVNIGTCLPVIFATLSMSKESLKSAVFNIAFNIIGSLIFFPILLFFGNNIITAKIFSNNVGRGIANFHTFFNSSVCIMLLPFLKPICNFIEVSFKFLYKDSKTLKKISKQRA